MLGIALAFGIAISSNAQTNQKTMNENTVGQLGVIHTKPGTWNTYLPIMLHNVKSSRKESGNISFTLYQPEDGSEVGIWLERWKDQAALENHFTYDYLKAVRKTVPEVKNEAVLQISLKEIPSIPTKTPTLNGVAPQSNVIVIFEPKQEERDKFLKAITEVILHARKASGNYGANIYQDTSNPDKFVFVEGWEDKAAHNAFLKQDISKAFDKATNGIFKVDPKTESWLAKDISE